MRRTIAVVGLAVLLTACGGGSEETLDAPQEAPLAGGEDFAAGEGEDADPADAEATTDTPQATTDGKTIPARFHGVWDALDADCANFSDGRTEISASEITYVEAYGEVSRVRSDGKDIIADIRLVEPGDEPPSDASERLSLVTTPMGVQLHITDGTKPKGESDFPLKRCEK